MVSLDWEKAFDKVDQGRLVEALSRLNIPQKVVDNVAALYADPKFKVKFNDNESEYKPQNSGIRQGCPLSPYLFLLVMTVMFDDIHTRNRHIINGRIDGVSFSEILYADDTLLLLKRTRENKPTAS